MGRKWATGVVIQQINTIAKYNKAWYPLKIWTQYKLEAFPAPVTVSRCLYRSATHSMFRLSSWIVEFYSVLMIDCLDTGSEATNDWIPVWDKEYSYLRRVEILVKQLKSSTYTSTSQRNAWFQISGLSAKEYLHLNQASTYPTTFLTVSIIYSAFVMH